MKKTIAFVCAILLLVFLAYCFTYKENGYMQHEAYVVNDITMIRNMLSGTTDDGTIKKLTKIEEGESLYTRGDSLYFGKDKTKIQAVAPYFVGNGTTLLIHEPSAMLISSEFSLLSTYENMYISKGHSFNSDGNLADEDEFLLLGLSSGVFLNVQDMKITYKGGSICIPANSILCIKEDVLRYYSLFDTYMEYECFTDCTQAEVTIGSVTMPYLTFFEQLFDVAKDYLPGRVIKQLEEEKKDEEKTTPVYEEATGEEQNEESSEHEINPSSIDNDTLTLIGGGDSVQTGESETEKTESTRINRNEYGKQQNASGEVEHQEGQMLDGNADIADEDLSAPIPYVKPSVTADQIHATVYTVTLNVHIDDPDNKLTKGAKIIIYKDGKTYMRKNVSTSCELIMGTLAPGSIYEIEGTYEYRTEEEGKATEVFLEKTEFETLTLSSLPAIVLDYHLSETIYAHQIAIEDFSICTLQTELNPTDQIINYITKIVIEAYKGGKSVNFEIPQDDLQVLKAGQSIDFLSSELLESNSVYSYKIHCYDRFSNELHTSISEDIETMIHTCKQAPTALVQLSSNAVGRIKLSVTLNDLDHTQMENGHLFLYDANGEAISVLLDGENQPRQYIDIDESKIGVKQTFTITNLPSNRQYTASTFCDYRTGVEPEHCDKHNIQIGYTMFYSAPLSVLGCVYFNTTVHDIGADYVTIRASVKQTTNEVLLSLLDTINFRLKCDRGEVNYRITKQELNMKTITPGVSFTELYLISDEITIKITGSASMDDTNLWDALIHGNAVLEYHFQGGTVSSLYSATNYLGYLDCTVDQGGIQQAINNPYTNATFKTLKEKPKFTYRGSIAANDFFEIYNLEIKDPDLCIENGVIYARLKSTISGKVVDMQIIAANQRFDKLSFTSLEKETEYTLEFLCKQYNEGFTVASASEQYVLPEVFTFTTGFSLTGKLSLSSLEYGDENQGAMFGNNLFITTNAIPDVRFSSTTGANDTTKAGIEYSITDYIKITGGEWYRMNDFYTQTSTTATRMTCHYYTYNEDTHTYELLPGNKGCVFGMQEALIKTPANAEYMRVEYLTKYGVTAKIRQVYYDLNSLENMTYTLEDTTYLSTNGTISVNNSYKCSDFIEVVEGAYYYRSTNRSTYGGVANRWVCFYDNRQEFLNWYAIDQNEALIQAPTNASYMKMFQSNTESSNVTLKKVSNGKNPDAVASCMLGEAQVIIQDKNRVLEYEEDGENLIGHYYLTINSENEQLSQNEYAFHTGGAGLSTEINIKEYKQLMLENDKEYTILLSVKLLSGQSLVLDQITLSTESNIKLLQNEYDVQNMSKDIYAKYRMSNDIIYTLTSIPMTYLAGEVDGNGYTLTMDNATYFIYSVRNSGVVRNLCFERTIPQDNTVTRYFIVYNYGSIHDVTEVRHTNSEVNKRANTTYFVYLNYQSGVVDRFAVFLDGDTYIGSSVITYYNYGTIRNGYVNGGDFYYTSGVYGGLYGSRSYVSAIAGLNNGGGIIENVYVAGDFYIESGTGTNNVAMLAGYNRNGIIRNSFSVGDRYVYTVDENNHFSPELNISAGPSVGNSAGSYENLCYISKALYASQDYIRTAAFTLWDSKWYQGNINCDGAFSVEENVNMGYYPKLNFKGKELYQPSYELPSYEPVQSPKLISAVVTDQKEDYAECLLTFRNPQRYTVNDFTINGLSCEILPGEESQYFDGDLYRVKCKVSSPTLYRSTYPILSTSFGYMGGYYTTTYGNAVGQEMPVNLNAEFWKHINSIAEWSSILLDLSGNYRVCADLNFEFSKAEDIVVRSAFKGAIDGGIYDEAEKLIGIHTLANLDMGNYGYVFYETKNATIENLHVTNITASQKPTMSGFIAYGNPGTKIDNIHIQNARFYARSYCGGICAYQSAAMICNCSVSDIKIMAIRAKSVAIGGLVGYANTYSTIENCYAAGIDLQIINAAGNKGSGGICGYFEGSKICDSYAYGKIATNFGIVGGITGYSTAYLMRCYTDIDIDTMAGNVGGIVGYYPTTGQYAKQLLSTGDIFTNCGSYDGMGRLFGYVQASSAYKNVYGYDGQLLAGALQPENVADENGNFTTEMLIDIDNFNGKNGFLSLGEGAIVEDEDGTENLSDIDSSLGEEGNDDRVGYFALTDIRDGFFPRLYSKKGELLPYQEKRILPSDALSINWNEDLSMADYNGAYRAVFSVYHIGYQVSNIKIEGMQLPDDIAPISSANGASMFDIQDIIPLECRDTFKLTVTLSKEDGTQTTLAIKVTFKSSNLFYEIRSAEDWQSIMAEHGDNYENFRIYGTIDLSEVSSTQLQKNIKIGRMTGFENATIIVKEENADSADNLIADCATQLSNITFRDSEWKTKAVDGSTFGLIGNLSGTAENISFINVEIESYNAEYAGCIGILSGYLKDTVMEDVRHLYRGGNYKGALAGRITALGHIDGLTITATNSGNTITDTYINQDVLLSNAWLIPSITSYASQYVGYLAGVSNGVIEHVNVSTEADSYIQVKGYLYVGGFVGSQGICADYSNGVLKDADAGNLYVVGGVHYTGGFIGITYYKIVDGHIENSIVYGGARTTGNYAGGLIGIYGGATDSSVTNCMIGNPKNNSYVGGALGSGYNIVNLNISVRDTTVQGVNRVGGIVGGMESIATNRCYQGCVVDNCHITAKNEFAGGIAGYGTNIRNNCHVLNSVIAGINYVGGIVGKTPPSSSTSVVIKEVGVTNTSVTASGYYAGGIAGEYDMMQLSNAYVNQVTVKAKQYAGGIAGIAHGGIYNNLCVYSSDLARDVKIMAIVKYAGGLFGDLRLKNESYGNPLALQQIYLVADVEAPDYTGGIAGTTMNNSDMSHNIVDEQVNGLLSAVRVKSTGPNLHISEASILTGMHSGLLVGELGDNTAQSIGLNAKSIKYYESSYAKISDGSKVTSEETDSTGDQFTYTSEQIASASIYTNTIENGGLGFSQDAFTFDAFNQEGDGEDAPYGYMPKVKSVTKVDGAFYLLSNQDNWIPVPVFSDLIMFSRRMFSMSRGIRMLPLPKLKIYASGADTINLEFDNTIPFLGTRNDLNTAQSMVDESSCIIRVLRGGEILFEQPVLNRVLTMQYDFVSDLSIQLVRNEESETYEIMPSQFHQTMWVKGNDYYYINDYGIYSNKGQMLGDFITATKGFALSYDGKLYSLETGEIIRNETMIQMRNEVEPLLQTINAGYVIDAYNDFSISYKLGESANSESKKAITEQLSLFTKEGELCAIDQDLLLQPTSFIYDRDDVNKIFFAVLGMDGSIVDMVEDTIIFPDKFRNLKIVEMSQNLYTELPILFVRYESDQVKAFNYKTGEEFNITASESDESLFEYAYAYLKSVTAPKKSVTGFKEVKALADTLLLNGQHSELIDGLPEDGELITAPYSDEEGKEEEDPVMTDEETQGIQENAENQETQESDLPITDSIVDSDTVSEFTNELLVYYDAVEEQYKIVKVETILSQYLTGAPSNNLMSGQVQDKLQAQQLNSESGSESQDIEIGQTDELQQDETYCYITERGDIVDIDGFNEDGVYMGEAVSTVAYQALLAAEEEKDKNVVIKEQSIDEKQNLADGKGITAIVVIIVVVVILGSIVIIKYGRKSKV